MNAKNKKKLFIHIGSLQVGGAEKSLVSFLNTLPKDIYDIDLMLLNNNGLFNRLVPKHINIISAPFPYNCLSISPKNLKYYLRHNPKYFIKKLYSYYSTTNNRKTPMDQVLWQIWRNDIKTYEKEYDLAISYLEGLTNYYVIDKVHAKRKIIWVHNEYTKLKYDKDIDRGYFSKADAIVTISEICKKDLEKNFPEYKEKFHILENITNPVIVRGMAEESIEDPIFNNNEEAFKILSIGRLFPQKNYPLAIDAAQILKDKGLNFKWYILGDGKLRSELEKKITSLSLEDNFILLGVRPNPYAYMKQCDIIVQSSLFEGKSIAIDEAKILCKPIVTTNYQTVYDVITDGINGLIAEMTPEALSAKIIELYNNPGLREEISSNLKQENVNNTSEIDNYIKLFG